MDTKTNSKMVQCSATHDDAFEATTRSVGCASALLPRISVKAIARWFRKEAKVEGVCKEEMAVSRSKAKRNCARDAPFVLAISKTLSDLVDYPPSCQEIESRTAFKKVRDVKTLAASSVRVVNNRGFCRNGAACKNEAQEVTTCYANTKNDKTMHSQAAYDSAAHLPSCLEIGSGTACKKVGDVNTPALSAGPSVRVAKGLSETGLPLCCTIYPPWCH